MNSPDVPFGIENLALAEALYTQYLEDPQTIDAEWRDFFRSLDKESNGNGASMRLGPTFKPASIFRSASSAPLADALPRVDKPAAGPLAIDVNPEKSRKLLPYVKRIALFDSLSEDDQCRVAAMVEREQYEPGSSLFSEGDPADALFMVLTGHVRLIQSDVLIARLGRGEVFGELALMDKRPRAADAVAETELEVLRLPVREFEHLLDTQPQIARALFHLVAKRLRETSARQERVDQMIRAYRVRGHVIAQIDPLGRSPKTHPELELEFFGLTEADLDMPVSARTWHSNGSYTLRGIIKRLRTTYCRSIGVQFMHINDLRLTRWLQERMESSENRRELGRDEQLRILEKLTDAETFEQFVHKKFLGAKRFSLEGGETLIPLLDMALDEASTHGVDEVVIGMPHRGRLNVLANIMGKRPQKIFEEFQDKNPQSYMGGGDVKYHLGYSNEYTTSHDKSVHLSLCFNPSHLEFVNPVVMGRVRAKQERLGDADMRRIMGIVIHGDAAFSGQGIVQEVLNMSQLPGYRVGGTLHIIVNNQIGFTTPPESGRSSQYSTDVARMLEIPIFHVNGEDPEGVAQAIRLALEFRATFQRDVVIDMYCYRKYGHNEGDEPTYTQPMMYKEIRERPSVRESYLDNLIKLGGITREEADEIGVKSSERLEEDLKRAQDAAAQIQEQPAGLKLWMGYTGGNDQDVPEVETGVKAEILQQLTQAQTQWPSDFHVHPKLARFFEQRNEMAQGKRPFDWGAAENLAFATLLAEGSRVRVSGQDSGRGTFSHRHSVLHDVEDGHSYLPLQHVQEGQADFQVWDSPLSESGVLGFDYGYSLDSPDALVIWEAQFGDFANGAQVIIDQFITSSEDKWKRLSGLVMLLPHGFEGQGPEHSSARLERFLTMCAEDNIQVAYPTTPAQIFHLLRRQVVRKIRKPLVIMSPKSLLRLPEATSPLSDLATGGFQRILGDTVVKPQAVKHIIMCTGKIYYDLAKMRQDKQFEHAAIVRLEQLYPLSEAHLRAALDIYPADAHVRWVQEEPLNMGAWPHLRLRHVDRIAGRPLSAVARAESASPATGSPSCHKYEQNLLLEEAFAAP